MRRRLAWALVLAAAGCDEGSSSGPCEPLPALAGSDNPLDRALAPAFAGSCLALREAEPRELCRRMFADLIGRYPTGDEVTRRCAGRAAEDIARELQADPRYLLHAERRWDERLVYFNTHTPRRLAAIYDLVDALHRGELRYDDFAARALAEPAVVSMGYGATIGLLAFHGRLPSALERDELGRLFELWSYAFHDGSEIPRGVFAVDPLVVPFACLGGGGCRTSLYGGGAVEIASRPVVPDDPLQGAIRFDELTAEERAVLQVPGRMIAGVPVFWEAAAGELLERFLGWGAAEDEDRVPEVLLARVRQALADHLAAGGDYPAAERLVVTSWLYRQSALAPGDERPLFALGPLKRAGPVVLLDSAISAAGVAMGRCDPRVPARNWYLDLMYRYEVGHYSTSELAAALRTLRPLIETHAPYALSERGVEEPTFRYEELADHLGGCTTIAEDGGAIGAVGHERWADELCAGELTSAGSALVRGFEGADPLFMHAMSAFVARMPGEAERAAVRSAFAGCGEVCDGELLRKDVCAVVLGSAEMMFY